jgi:hypothetical protein
MGARWPAFCSEKDSISVDRAALLETTTIVFVGGLARQLQVPLKLPAWTL